MALRPCLAALLILAPAAGWAQLWSDAWGPELVTLAFDEPRGSESDIVRLRSGDTLVGQVEWSVVEFLTPLGRLSVPARRVAAIDFGSHDGAPERLLGVNGDLLSGVLLFEEVLVEVAGGDAVAVPCCLIERIVTRHREDERHGLPRRQAISLTNGDHFTGALRGEGLTLCSGREPLGLSISLVESLAPHGWAPGAEVTLIAGETRRGDLSTAVVWVEPDLCAGIGDAAPLEVPLLRLASLLAHDVPQPPSESAQARVCIPINVDEVAVGGIGAGGNLADGPDAFHFCAVRGMTYRIRTEALSQCDTVLSLWQSDHTTMLRENDDGPGVGNPASQILWTCPADGTYFLRVRDLDDRHQGSYSLRIDLAPRPAFESPPAYSEESC